MITATSVEVRELPAIVEILGKVAHKLGIRYFGNHYPDLTDALSSQVKLKVEQEGKLILEPSSTISGG